MRPSSKNLVMNGIIESYIYQKKLDESQGTSFADTWKAFNGANIALGDLYLDEGAFAMLSALKCTFGAFNCIFKDGSRGACLVWIDDGYVWAVEMKDEGALKAHKVDTDGIDVVFESDEGASAIITALLCVTNAVGGGTSGDAVTLDTKQTITGEKTFTAENGIGVDSIHNTDGNALARYKKTEGKQVFGSSELPTVLMGSGDRPTYSKDGSDFDGNELGFIYDVVIQTTDCSSMFSNNKSLKKISLFNTQNVTNMNSMFYVCESLVSVSYFDTSNVTNMQDMFIDCESLTTVPQFDTSNVITMRGMFKTCLSLTTVPLFDTSKVMDMNAMFLNCKSLTTVPQFDTSNVTDMGYMFSYCSSLTEIHMISISASLDIHWSTKMERTALLEVINNLSTVTSTKTLTLGDTLKAKLTDDDIAIATNKGWTVA